MKRNRSAPHPIWHEFVPKSWDFLNGKYSWRLFKSDLAAGLTVGLVALPLAMVFAIAAGLPPERGLYTAIVAGFLTSLLGGSRFQIGGPTGAFVVIIYSIMQRNEYAGLVAITLLAGIILLGAAFCRLGNLIKYIPYPLVTGFTTGIAVVIFSSQIKDFLGLTIDKLPADFIPKWMAIIAALPTFDLITCAVASGTLLFIILIRHFVPALPWGISSVALATFITWGFHLPVETIATRFGGISGTLPLPALPNCSALLQNWHLLLMDAITIAFLAGIESLLSAMVADGMAGTRHRSNCELMAQGVANIGSVLCGGIPTTGAIARTATNVKTGGKTPVAGMIHAITLLVILLAFAPIVSQISIAVLSAVLMMVAWNMSEIDHFRHLFRAPAGDVIVLLTTFFLTVLVDLTVAVQIGMVLAAFLFMKRMADLSGVVKLSVTEPEEPEHEEEYELGVLEHHKLPPGVEVYEITGPFFFGVADSLKDLLTNLERPPQIFILRMRKVPVIDASGMHALKEFYFKCARDKTTLLLSGVAPSLHKLLKKFGVTELIGEKQIFPTIETALQRASKLVAHH